jgi:non-ribosomal peptide synthetase-like protein
MSTPPAGTDHVENKSQWLGSPGFTLPRPEAEKSFDDAQTFNPDKSKLRLRAMIDIVRILLPGYLSVAALGAIMAVAATGYRLIPWWAVALALPIVANLVAAATVIAVAVIKRVVMGTFEPGVHPLYSPFVWLNDVINGVFEAVAAVAMTPFMGTPFLAPLLRAMGCRIGKWCFLETTLVSEFDLVRIGDHASLNLGATLQTHLFEDRVMKSDTLVIGDGCNVGNMAIVLYATEMQRGSTLGSLSVLMKGETLPPMSRWRGIPSEPIGPRPVPSVPKPQTETLEAAMAAAQ